jgi:hypothetical protein
MARDKGTFFLSILLTLLASDLFAQQSIHFGGGQPHKNYQPSLILPILVEAFHRHGIKFLLLIFPALDLSCKPIEGKLMETCIESTTFMKLAISNIQT